MTTPALSFSLRGRGRHYPLPPVDPSTWPKNRWGSIDPSSIPGGVTPLPSVTNITSVCGGGDGLFHWAGACAIEELYASETIPLRPEVAVERHKSAFSRRRQERADEGTRAHTLAERLTRDLPLPSSLSDQDEAFADAYMKFWTEVDPEPVHVEATVYGDGWAGTADLIARVDGAFTVLDWKTRAQAPDAKKVARYGLLYESNRLQLAALASAHSVAVPTDSGWMLDALDSVEQAMGVVLCPDGSYFVETLDWSEIARWYDGFRGALNLWGAVKGAAA